MSRSSLALRERTASLPSEAHLPSFAAAIAEYPDPQHYDPITDDEVDDAIDAVRACLPAAEKPIAAPQLGFFCPPNGSADAWLGLSPDRHREQHP